ncbi:MAG: MATE family efflux transporter [Candidatus Izemoplasmataceae bacterium]
MTKTDYATPPINHELRKIALPAAIGFLFSTLFNVVDSYFAGTIGTNAIAGMTLAFPVFFLLLALASGMGAGMNALASIAIGSNDRKQFLSLLKTGILITLFFGVIIPFLAPYLARLVFTFQGAEEDAIQYAMRYITTVMVGFTFFMVNFIFNGVLYAQGDSRPFRNFLIVASVVNIILNPLFINGFLLIPPLDTKGIALATILVQMGGSVYLFMKVRKSPWVNFTAFKTPKVTKATALELFRQGIPSALNNATIALGIFVINYYVQYYGQTATLAAYGIAIRIEQLALVPAVGINVAVISIVGRSYGARAINRIYEVWKRATIAGLIIMGVGVAFIVPFAPYFIAVFDDTAAVVDSGTRYLRIEAFAFFSYVFLNVGVALLQGVKHPGFAFWIGIFRQLLPIGLFYFLGTILSMGIDGVWWGIVIINWTAVGITLFYASYVLRKIKTGFSETMHET